MRMLDNVFIICYRTFVIALKLLIKFIIILCFSTGVREKIKYQISDFHKFHLLLEYSIKNIKL